MSRLDELIEEFCPEGVEYKCLGDIGQVKIPFFKIGTFCGKSDSFISV